MSEPNWSAREKGLEDWMEFVGEPAHWAERDFARYHAEHRWREEFEGDSETRNSFVIEVLQHACDRVTTWEVEVEPAPSVLSVEERSSPPESAP